jgi:hypothetical protein
MRLDERLIEERTTDGKIDFHEHISRVREEASSWLKGIEKNGVDHSERLEDYLDRLIPDEFKKKLKPAEVFILLYAVYLHDIGYRNEQGEIESRDHPLRSKKYILKNPKKYLFDQFPPMKKGEAPLAAQAVADVCYGHAHESVCPLRDIPNDFTDVCLCKKILNLRCLAALLRLADEMDQAYIRLGHLRNCISLPAISPGIVRMHWKGDQSVGEALGDLVQGINETLEPVNDLLTDWGFPKTTVVLDPLVKKSLHPPQEPIDYKEFIPKHYIPSRCHDEKGKDKGLLHDYVRKWLNDPKRKLLAVLGDYGIGKTSFCYKFASDLTEYHPTLLTMLIKMLKFMRKFDSDLTRPNCVPVVIELRKIREVDAQWRELIEREVALIKPTSRDILLIMDGFDELSLKFDKEKVLKEIENLSETTRDFAKVILTSRTQFFLSRQEEREVLMREPDIPPAGPLPIPYAEKFERIYVSFFSHKEVKAYLNLALGKREASDFWNNVIDKVFDIKDLAKRPILLELITKHSEDISKMGGRACTRKYHAFFGGAGLPDVYQARKSAPF